MSFSLFNNSRYHKVNHNDDNITDNVNNIVDIYQCANSLSKTFDMKDLPLSMNRFTTTINSITKEVYENIRQKYNLQDHEYSGGYEKSGKGLIIIYMGKYEIKVKHNDNLTLSLEMLSNQKDPFNMDDDNIFRVQYWSTKVLVKYDKPTIYEFDNYVKRFKDVLTMMLEDAVQTVVEHDEIDDEYDIL